MRVLVFGTYEKWRYPRLEALIEGLRAHGDEVVECNVPLGLGTDARMLLLQRPWRLPGFALRLLSAWWRLRRRARALPDPDAVLVPYMGHFDVHLARALWPRTPIALDHLISAAGTARDRRLAMAPVRTALEVADRLAVARADVVAVDTDEHLRALPPGRAERGVVVAVGAPAGFFDAADRLGDPHHRLGDPADQAAHQLAAPPVDQRDRPRLLVGFFGIYTPLHGSLTIAEAIARLADEPIDFVMVGSGQEREAARRIAAANPHVRWVDWLTMDELRDEVGGWDVSLGIFGTTPKARSVVPHKVYLGAASGSAVVTSDTPPQRRALDDDAVFVPPGDPEALAAALAALARDPARVRALQRAVAARARSRFHPDVVVAPLRERLAALVAGGAGEEARP